MLQICEMQEMSQILDLSGSLTKKKRMPLVGFFEI